MEWPAPPACNSGRRLWRILSDAPDDRHRAEDDFDPPSVFCPVIVLTAMQHSAMVSSTGNDGTDRQPSRLNFAFIHQSTRQAVRSEPAAKKGCLEPKERRAAALASGCQLTGISEAGHMARSPSRQGLNASGGALRTIQIASVGKRKVIRQLLSY